MNGNYRKQVNRGAALVLFERKTKDTNRHHCPGHWSFHLRRGGLGFSKRLNQLRSPTPRIVHPQIDGVTDELCGGLLSGKCDGQGSIRQCRIQPSTFSLFRQRDGHACMNFCDESNRVSRFPQRMRRHSSRTKLRSGQHQRFTAN